MKTFPTFPLLKKPEMKAYMKIFCRSLRNNQELSRIIKNLSKTIISQNKSIKYNFQNNKIVSSRVTFVSNNTVSDEAC